ncbi:MAG: T9SS type A sorting domain-containing protein [Chitinophagales bacterium]
MKKALVLILFFLLLIDNISGQVTFQKSFSTGSNGNPSVAQTIDGGYIIAGDLLIRTNESGDTLWTRYYNYGTSNCATPTFDGGYAIAGYTSIDGASNDYYLTKTDSLGNILWSKAYGGESYDEAYTMQQTSDSGFILAGNTWSFGSGGWDFYLVKTDAEGNILWTKIIGGAEEDKAATIKQTSDDGFIVAGYTTSFGSVGPDAFLIKTDDNGNIEWAKIYNGPGGEFVTCIRQSEDGGYFFTGHAVNFTTTGQDLFLIKTDAEGNVQWSRFFTHTNNIGNAVAQTNDGGYIITGSTLESSANGNDVLLIKTDAAGDTLWTRVFGGTGYDAGTDVKQTNNGEYIIAGKITSFGTGFYLLKTDNLGNTGCNQATASIQTNNSPVSELNVTCTVYSAGAVTPFDVTAGSGTVVNDICFTAIEELSIANSLQFFPNPSQGFFSITLGERIVKGSVSIFNALGKIVFEEEIVNTSTKEIHLQNLPEGIYFVKVFSRDNYYNIKLLLNRTKTALL